LQIAQKNNNSGHKEQTILNFDHRMNLYNLPTTHAQFKRKRRRTGGENICSEVEINLQNTGRNDKKESHCSIANLSPHVYDGNKRRRNCTSSYHLSIPNNQACFVSLPDELLLHIISFIGPTSSTLLDLAQLTKYHSELLYTVGNSMLIRAKSHFRTLLPLSYPHESSISSFVKHAQFCKGVREKMKLLTEILEKNFVVDPYQLSSSEECIDVIHHFRCRIGINRGGVRVGGMTNDRMISETSVGYGDDNIVTKEEVDLALNLATSLLESVATTTHCNNVSYSASYAHNVSSHEIEKNEVNSVRCVSDALQRKILTLCGKCGGIAFKYAKMRLWMRNVGIALALNRQDITSSTFVRELIMREGDKLRLIFIQLLSGTKNDCEADQLPHAIPDYEKSKDEQRMYKASSIMRSVVCHDLELSAKDAVR